MSVRWNALPVESVEGFPQFCSYCGHPVVRTDEKGSYDPTTGRQRVIAAARCSRPWWRGGNDIEYGHGWYVVSPRPAAIAYAALGEEPNRG